MHARRSILALVFLAGAFVGSRFAGGAPTPAPVAVLAPKTVVAPSDADLDPWVGFDPIVSAAPTAPACDETAQMMAEMFGALANQALANAGKSPEQLNASVAGDREAFIAYLAALGISTDDPQVAVMLGAAFPISSGLPEIAPAC
jgi:hypothetical protein